MKHLRVVILFLFSISILAQDYSGPESGVTPPGKVVSTNDFSATPAAAPVQFRLFEHPEVPLIPDTYNHEKPAAPLGSNFIEDVIPNKTLSTKTDSVILFKDFQGLLHENSIPPDPYIAVGPAHIMLVVNGYFRITDKEGNTIKTISASQWYSKVLPGASVFDPKVIYDPYDRRWVMVWLDANDNTSDSYFMFSVSDDADPTGNWFVWAMPANVYGSTPSGSWADYEGIGFDDKAIYLTSNQFTFGNNASYDGTRLRIIPKKGIYVADSASSFTYTDIWNVKYPGSSYGAFGMRPARMYSKNDSYFFVKHSPYVTGTQVAVYELIDPLGDTPTLQSYKIPITAYRSAPNANQLGGGKPLIEGGGSAFRNEPVYKNGILYLVHSVEYQENGKYSGVHFLALDLFSQTPLVDFVFGKEHYYYIYPALAVDGKNNVFISYSRSGDYEYCGAYFSVVPAEESAPTASVEIQKGKAHYNVTYGGSRNRWGDYSGAWQDPVDTNNVWLFAEYVNQTDRWGTWVAGARYTPFEVPFVATNVKSIEYGENEIGKGLVAKEVKIKNYGKQQLTINSVSVNNTQLTLTVTPSLPATLNAYDSVLVEVTFTPSTPGFFTDSLTITSTDPSRPTTYVKVSGRAYRIDPVEVNKFYACTASSKPSDLFLLDETNGAATDLGSIEYANVNCLSIKPESGELMGLITDAESSSILRINASAGDGHDVVELPKRFSAISFASDTVFYAVTTTKQLYKLSYPALDTTFVMDLSVVPLTLAYNHLTGELWFSTRTGMRTGNLYCVNLQAGTVQEVASLDVLINDLAFDNSGDLFAVHGTSSYLALIDTATGVNHDIGKTGKIRVKGLAIKGDIVVSVIEGEHELTPVKFALQQNHPNPFNPSTKISFALPAKAFVSVNIYNLLGQKVTTLLNKELTAGWHEVDFNAENLGSGTYFYELVAKTANGKVYKDVKKMVLLK